MLQRPCSFKKPQASVFGSILRFGRIMPSTTCSSSFCSSKAANGTPSPPDSRHASYGSRITDSPMPWQQSLQPLQPPQSARTISFLLYNLPSEISSRLTFLFINLLLCFIAPEQIFAIRPAFRAMIFFGTRPASSPSFSETLP